MTSEELNEIDTAARETRESAVGNLALLIGIASANILTREQYDCAIDSVVRLALDANVPEDVITKALSPHPIGGFMMNR